MASTAMSTDEPGSTVAESAARVGDGTSLTVIVTVAGDDVLKASEAVNVNVSVPMNPAFARYLTVGGVPDNVPCWGDAAITNVIASSSGSVAVSVRSTGAVREVCADCGFAVGGWLWPIETVESAHFGSGLPLVVPLSQTV